MKRIKYRKIHRIFAAFLCVCIILALPGISDIIPVIAAGQEENVKGDNIIAEFSPLPDARWE